MKKEGKPPKRTRADKNALKPKSQRRLAKDYVAEMAESANATGVEIDAEVVPRDVINVKVLLLDDEEYTSEHLAQSLKNIVGDNIFASPAQLLASARRGEEAIISITEQELGEFYVEQLARMEPMIITEIQVV